LAGIHFTVKIQNPAKRRFFAIFMVEKHFAAKISVCKRILKMIFKVFFKFTR